MLSFSKKNITRGHYQIVKELLLQATVCRSQEHVMISTCLFWSTQRKKFLVELSANPLGPYLTRKTSLVCRRAGRKLNAIRVVSRRSFSSTQQVFAVLLPEEAGATRFRPRMQKCFVLSSGHSSAIVAVKQGNLVRLARFAP